MENWGLKICYIKNIRASWIFFFFSFNSRNLKFFFLFTCLVEFSFSFRRSLYTKNSIHSSTRVIHRTFYLFHHSRHLSLFPLLNMDGYTTAIIKQMVKNPLILNCTLSALTQQLLCMETTDGTRKILQFSPNQHLPIHKKYQCAEC